MWRTESKEEKHRGKMNNEDTTESTNAKRKTIVPYNT